MSDPYDEKMADVAVHAHGMGQASAEGERDRLRQALETTIDAWLFTADKLQFTSPSMALTYRQCARALSDLLKSQPARQP